MKNKDLASIYKTIADSFQSLSEIYSSATEETVKVSEPAPATDTPAEPVTEEKTYNKEDVRAMLSQKAKIDGCKYKVEVKELVAKSQQNHVLLFHYY